MIERERERGCEMGVNGFCIVHECRKCVCVCGYSMCECMQERARMNRSVNEFCIVYVSDFVHHRFQII